MPKIIFNQEKEELLLEMYKTKTTKELAIFFGCAESTIKNKLCYLGAKKPKAEKYRLHAKYLERGASLKREQGREMREWLNSFFEGETRIVECKSQLERNQISVAVCRWNVDVGRLKKLLLKIEFERKPGFANITAYRVVSWQN